MNILGWIISFAGFCIVLFILIEIGGTLLTLIVGAISIAIYGITAGINFIVNSLINLTRRVFNHRVKDY